MAGLEAADEFVSAEHAAHGAVDEEDFVEGVADDAAADGIDGGLVGGVGGEVGEGAGAAGFVVGGLFGVGAGSVEGVAVDAGVGAFQLVGEVGGELVFPIQAEGVYLVLERFGDARFFLREVELVAAAMGLIEVLVGGFEGAGFRGTVENLDAGDGVAEFGNLGEAVGGEIDAVAVGVEAVDGDGGLVVGERTAHAEGGFAIEGLVGEKLQGGGEAGDGRGRRFGDEINHAGDGLGAVEHGGGAFHDFDAVDEDGGEKRCTVNLGEAWIQRCAVEEDGGVVGGEAEELDLVDAAVLAVVFKADAGHEAEAVGEGDAAARFDFGGGENVGFDRRVAEAAGGARAGHGDGVEEDFRRVGGGLRTGLGRGEGGQRGKRGQKNAGTKKDHDKEAD